MKILHYSLGFPPYRSGGLTKFCMDLMGQQIKDGHEVALMWPGAIKFTGGGTEVKDRGYVNNIQSFEVLNPLPVPYDEGIAEIDKFIADVPEKPYKDFLMAYKPDVIHIHTLMGMHEAFLSSAKKLNIRTVFTAHDFFSICPKVKLFRQSDICLTADTCEDCPQCNQTALSMWKVKILQSPIYRSVKDSSAVKALRKNHRSRYLNEGNTQDTGRGTTNSDDYLRLREHFMEMLSMVDRIHYNSTVTKNVYEQFDVHSNSKVIPITHANIEDHRHIKKFGENLRMTFLGSDGGAKGFFVSRRLSMNCGKGSRIFA